MARSAKELGACCLILERVSETVNEVLSLRNDQGLPIYSIFSGKAHGGGQNLNVWDSVYIPDFKAYFFPPTSKFDVNTYPATYTEESIKTCFKELLELTFTGQFPKSPPEPLNSEEILKIMSQSPWSPTVKCEKNPLEMMSMG